MGTHPIFESDFDCLTENERRSFGPLGRIYFPEREIRPQKCCLRIFLRISDKNAQKGFCNKA